MSKTIKHYKKYKEKKQKQKEQEKIEKRIEKLNKDYEKRLRKHISASKSKNTRELWSDVGNVNHTYEKSMQIWLKRKSSKIVKKATKISKNKKPRWIKYKSTNSLKKSLYSLVQLYARLRDSDIYGYWNCISCGRRVHYTKADWWHYISRRFMISAFDTDNIHLQCKTCNKPKWLWGKNWNIECYRPKLIEKIWLWKVLKLENDKNTIKNWSIAELEKLIKSYSAKNKRLKNKKL